MDLIWVLVIVVLAVGGVLWYAHKKPGKVQQVADDLADKINAAKEDAKKD